MSDLISLKITIKDDANYLLFGDRICRDVKELEAFCKNRFQDLQKNVDEFRYYWIDDDGDEIRVKTDEDYRSFLQAMANTKARLYVVGKNVTVDEPGNQEESDAVQAGTGDDAPVQNHATGGVLPVHQHVICDVCDKEIVGHRYKCLTCHDYDLCMSCEAKFRHKDHLMLRIPKPAMVVRSQSTVTRLFVKLRMYAARITSNMEKESAGPEPEVSFGPGNEVTSDANGMKRANARSGHRYKQSSEESRTNTTEPSKPSRSGKTSVGADRKQISFADESSGERSTKESKEKPSPRPTVSEMTQRCRDVMVMYLNSTEAMDSKGNPVPWSTTDHVAVANMAAATATAAAARAAAVAKKALQMAAKAERKTVQQMEPTQEELTQMLRHATATMKLSQKRAAPTTAPPPATSAMPVPILPFFNLPWPSQEKLMVASENVSKLLDPLGLSFEIRHKSAAEPSTSGGVSASSTTTTTTLADAGSSLSSTKKQEEANEPLDKKQDVPSLTKEPEQVATFETVAKPSSAAQDHKGKAGTEKSISDIKEELNNPFSSMFLEYGSEGVNKPETTTVENEAYDEDDSQNNSSASLLTDDDQDLLEVYEEANENPASSSAKPPKLAEKCWTLIDLPHENGEETIAANVAPPGAIAKLIGQDISSTTIDKEESAQPPKPLLLSKEKKEKSPEESKLKEMKNVRKIIAAAEQKEEPEPGSSAAMKEIMKLLTPASLAAAPSSSSAAGSSSSAGRSAKNSRKSSTAQKDCTIYSHRPHVNHAIHTMMTMGFSNHNGWLTQLLESLNGDIPKALDLLLMHRH